ncbi:MAG: transcriptional repressor [Bryobacteraceae bacterium]
MKQELLSHRMERFRERCAAAGLTVTHQRAVIYETLCAASSHPTPEAVYEAVREKIPAISLATVYKSIRTFLDVGVLREVNLLHDTQRLDANLAPHHHLVCERCRGVVDVSEDTLAPLEVRGRLPGKFRARQFRVEILGLCAQCSSLNDS